MSLFHSFIIALGLCSLLMFFAWIGAMRISNFSIVDGVWAGAFFMLGLHTFFAGEGLFTRKLLVMIMVCFWSGRLTLHLALRIGKLHPREDKRYLELRKVWAKNLSLRFLIFYQVQGLSVALLSIPFFMASWNRDAPIRMIEWLAFILWILAFSGESVADRQLRRFKENDDNRGKICQVGLWNYSRHPNYFFEWLIWSAFYIFAIGTRNGILTFYCPAIMLYLLLKVTGIPALEKESLKSKGDLYGEYQRTTSSFVPWFKRT